MQLSADLREFIELLNSRGVDYIIVGAHSLAFHGKPRFTGDLGILVRPMPENAARLGSVLRDFGFGAEFSARDFLEEEQLIQLGRAPHRIDLLTSLSGVEIEEAFATKVDGEIDAIPVGILSKPLLIKNKKTVGRPQDLADLESLQDNS
jgi:hypothetical protein